MSHRDRPRPSTAAVVFALLVVYVVWGSTYLGIAIMIETMPPLLAAGVRYGVAGALMLGALVVFARVRRRAGALERPTRAHWRSAIVVGALLLLGGNGGVVLAELHIASGIAAVLVAMVPIWLAILDAAITRRRPSRLVVGGLIAGIVGVAVLLIPTEGVAGVDPLGILLVVGASLSWAIGSLYARSAPMPRSGLLGTGMEMLAGGVVLVLAASLLGEVGQVDLSSMSNASLLAMLYLIFFGSILAFTAYTWLLANVPVSTVATYAYVNPVVAMALGAIVRSEPITPRTILATALILGAIIAMVSGRPREAEEPGPAPEAATLEPESP